jgi:hypothetical protein
LAKAHCSARLLTYLSEITMDYNPNMPQSSMSMQMYPQNGMMGNPQYNQLMQAQVDPVQQQMQAYQDQMRQQQMMQIMGQGIQNMAKGMQKPMPSANTAQIIRDQNQFRMAGTPQQQMAQALRNRG